MSEALTWIEVTLNGSPRRVPAGLTVRGLLEHLEIAVELVAVEVNLEVIPRGRHDDVVIAENDRIEVVSFVGGG